MERMTSKCPDGHLQTWACGKGCPAVCDKCERAKKLAKKKQQDELEAQLRRDAEQKAHLEKMDALNAQIDQERRSQENARLVQERAEAIKQRKSDLESVRASGAANVAAASSQSFGKSANPSTPDNNASGSTQANPGFAPPRSSNGNVQGAGVPSATAGASKTNKPSAPKQSASGIPSGKPFKDVVESPSQTEWKRQKNIEGAQSDAIDSIMDMIGLETVKERILGIKAKIDTNIRQGTTLKGERFNVVLLGNPGTGLWPLDLQNIKHLIAEC